MGLLRRSDDDAESQDDPPVDDAVDFGPSVRRRQSALRTFRQMRTVRDAILTSLQECRNRMRWTE